MPLKSSYCSKHSRHNSWNTPERTHAWKWVWAVEPEPYSRGIIFHWHPVRSTYRTPLNTTMCDIGRRPPLGPIGWSGIRGERIVQNSSGTSRQPGCRFSGWRFSTRRRFVSGAGFAFRGIRWSSMTSYVVGRKTTRSLGYRTHSKSFWPLRGSNRSSLCLPPTDVTCTWRLSIRNLLAGTQPKIRIPQSGIISGDSIDLTPGFAPVSDFCG